MRSAIRNSRRCGRIMAWSAAALLPALAGCHDYRGGMAEAPLDGEELPILRQVAGTHSHETRALQVVVRDPAALAQMTIEDVSVDFAREMLLVVTLGRVMSDQYGIHIDRVWRDGAKLRVSVAITSPPPGAPIGLSTPYCIAVVPRCPLNVADFAPEPPQRSRSWNQSPPPTKM